MAEKEPDWLIIGELELHCAHCEHGVRLTCEDPVSVGVFLASFAQAVTEHQREHKCKVSLTVLDGGLKDETSAGDKADSGT